VDEIIKRQDCYLRSSKLPFDGGGFLQDIASVKTASMIVEGGDIECQQCER